MYYLINIFGFPISSAYQICDLITLELKIAQVTMAQGQELLIQALFFKYRVLAEHFPLT